MQERGRAMLRDGLGQFNDDVMVFSTGDSRDRLSQASARRAGKIRVFPKPNAFAITMSLHNVTPGAKAPEQFNVIIEIPMNADPIKYEVDKETGAIFVDRFMTTAMHYPCNYGYIPRTLSDDGDPVDVLVVTPFPLTPGVVVTC